MNIYTQEEQIRIGKAHADAVRAMGANGRLSTPAFEQSLEAALQHEFGVDMGTAACSLPI